ncbi:hypothetical protein P152DRAFT_225706 [Eremomyces bilateralis CBS 781.70]|uniref:Uncharacterized protein n=1 Tax=Eremomyces bilateralis CBS 781.70 TaxID=1392243 RepID=A0A6G1FRD0_9PEZI|nr:uncharacterized protein P152DRAFT_225706 [Eremomyces bilateralis CBS 781.70]KAF1808286.1 hypothetical protein P152DRAFT_225706 [Eremomyces bilateralis CBS 781.70]
MATTCLLPFLLIRCLEPERRDVDSRQPLAIYPKKSIFQWERRRRSSHQGRQGRQGRQGQAEHGTYSTRLPSYADVSATNGLSKLTSRPTSPQSRSAKQRSFKDSTIHASEVFLDGGLDRGFCVIRCIGQDVHVFDRSGKPRFGMSSINLTRCVNRMARASGIARPKTLSLVVCGFQLNLSYEFDI